jgi:hypothetical protein
VLVDRDRGLAEQFAELLPIGRARVGGPPRKDRPDLVEYADLCRARHKSAYAEVRVMPSGLLAGLPGGQVVVMGSA